ncbi:BTAD domain-containing putative transcriptional regulator [Actinokineospora sp. HUAS TT18]|uniref:AfsR/SARP family transcriptional regulator n=1 Tax=Actinokineospora sp. HUAS TT18 TaxID=3447451 RepID=UPI003F51EC84
MDTRFRLLGGIDAERDGVAVDLGHARQRMVLAALLADPNRPTPVPTLVDRVWGEQPPASAAASVHSYVSRLRKALADATIQRAAGGYQLDVDTSKVDLHEFRSLIEAARGADDAAAGPLLDRAMGLWRGRPFGAADSPWLNRMRDIVERERFTAEIDLIEIRLGQREHTTVLPRLAELSAEHPLDERLAGLIMLALSASGRQAEALAHYDTLRRRLADELGIDPGGPLREVHRRVLEPDGPRRSTGPAQLPPDARHFTGRVADLAELSAVLASHSTEQLTLCSIEGTAGVGKTTLAVRFARQEIAAFPGGQLFLNLRGYGPGDPMSDEAALTALLQGVGVRGDQLPAGLDARAALWRTHTTGRRLLILLDNATDSAQVRRLLPGPGSVVLVTSRTRLRGLVVREGAHRLSLGRMPTDDAIAMLRGIIGHQRVTQTPDQVRRVIGACAHLPLAIRILGERASEEPHSPLDGLLGEGSHRLAAFDLDDDDDSDLRSVFLRSYQALNPDTARLFRLLGAQNAIDFTASSAAAVGSLTESAARSLLDRLSARNMVERSRVDHYQFHDLMRDFARALAQEVDSESVPGATRRLLEHYLAGLSAANAILGSAPEAGIPARTFLDAHEALEWCDQEWSNVALLVTNATEDIYLDLVARFSGTFFRYLVARAHQADEWIKICEHTLSAARAIGDEAAQLPALNCLAVVHSVRGDHNRAIDSLEHMLAVARATQNREREINALNNLAIVYAKAGRAAENLGCARQLLTLSTGDSDEEGRAHATLASAYHYNGDYGNAVSHAKAAIALCASDRLRSTAASAHHTLGTVLAKTGDSESSIANYESALALYRELDVTYIEGDILLELGDVHLDIGAPEDARRHWRRAAEIFRQTDSLLLEDALRRLGESP